MQRPIALTEAVHIEPLVELANYVEENSTHPSRRLHVIGITGTNGKTTVAYLIGEVLKAAGFNPFVLGTLNSGNKDLSTPEPSDILCFMEAHLKRGGTHFIMEVTSEGIDQARILGIDFDIKLLTNITRDHLDYHKTFPIYKKVKMDFMKDGEAHKVYPQNFAGETIGFTTQLLGDYNLLNMKAAANVLRHMAVSEERISQTLSSCAAPKGRLERVDMGQPYLVLIDYAHTPDALENVLSTAKQIALTRGGELLVLFGCGGNRDSGKRAEMGKVASEIADFMVLTDDNPRQEESQDILAQINEGIAADFYDYTMIPNRREAIDFLVNRSQSDDVIVLAGKGHETYQTLKSGTIHFDDREEVSEAISIRLGGIIEMH